MPKTIMTEALQNELNLKISEITTEFGNFIAKAQSFTTQYDNLGKKAKYAHDYVLHHGRAAIERDLDNASKLVTQGNVEKSRKLIKSLNDTMAQISKDFKAAGFIPAIALLAVAGLAWLSNRTQNPET